MSLITGRNYAATDSSKQNLPIAVDATGAILFSGGATGGMTDAQFQANFPLPVEQTTVARTPSFIRPTVSGTVTAGAQAVTFYAVSGTITVLGTALNVGETVSFSANGNDTLAAIAYTVAAGQILIVEVR